MTDDQIHKEVLKVMGWVCIDESKEFGPLWWRKGTEIQSWPTEALPPITLDLMRDAWLTLNAKQRAKYAEELAYVVLACHNDPKQEFVFSRYSLSLFANATAIERARAFLSVKSTPSP